MTNSTSFIYEITNFIRESYLHSKIANHRDECARNTVDVTNKIIKRFLARIDVMCPTRDIHITLVTFYKCLFSIATFSRAPILMLYSYQYKKQVLRYSCLNRDLEYKHQNWALSKFCS